MSIALRPRLDRLATLPIDLPLAVALAGATGFFAWALPARLVSRAVLRLHVPSVLPMAAPPLGDTARIALAVAVALAAGAVGWLALRFADRAPRVSVVRERKPVVKPTPIDWAASPLRRGDAHPDAPPRRPIFAEQDLALPPEAIIHEAAAPLADAELLLDAAAEPVEPVEADSVGADRVEAIPTAPATAEVLESPGIAHHSASLPVASAPETIEAMMARLEAGLARREAKPTSAVRPSADPTPIDHALRGALHELRRMAGQG